jgi:hypothetical protein
MRVLIAVECGSREGSETYTSPKCKWSLRAIPLKGHMERDCRSTSESKDHLTEVLDGPADTAYGEPTCSRSDASPTAGAHQAEAVESSEAWLGRRAKASGRIAPTKRQTDRSPGAAAGASPFLGPAQTLARRAGEAFELIAGPGGGLTAARGD